MRYAFIVLFVASLLMGAGLACGDKDGEEASPTKVARPTFAREPSPTSVPERTSTPGATATPAQATPSPTWTPDTLPAITITSPAADSKITSPVEVRGTARVFEAAVTVRVRNSKGDVVGQQAGTASSGAPQRGNYAIVVTFTPPAEAEPGTVEAFSRSPRDGSIENLVAMDVLLMPGP